MKEIKCPLCGRSLQFFPDLHEIAMGRIGCLNCCWTTFLGFEETAWQEAKKIISKFPPIMRVNQGDNLKLDFEDDILTVIDKDTDRGKLYLENCRGDVEIATSDDVDKWPWELEQEGGADQ